jgi:beta-lactamase superfamily II metal-dependent hydrolase
MRRSYVAALALIALIVNLAAYWGLGRPRKARPSLGIATVEFLDVGQGDAILIRSPEGKTALVDAGPSGRVVDLLRDRGVESIDLVVVSHHHIDHYGGMPAVVRAYRPRVFLDADSPHMTPTYLKLLEQVAQAGITAIRAGPRSRRIDLGSVAITVFPQAPPNDKEENNNSIGLRVEFGEFSALLTGDSERSERRWWMGHVPDLCANVEVLKLAHHGSRNGTDRAWLDLTRPRLAVASLGRDNEFGHPHAETLALLGSLDIPLMRTDESGSIPIRTDGRNWSTDGPSVAARAPPEEGRESPRSAPSEERQGFVDLNTASEDELRTLPGIGPVLARRIVEGRPYRSVDDLSSVPEMGKKRIEHIRPFVVAK